MEIVDDPVAAYPPAPGGRLSLQALDIAPKGIVLHGEQGSFNAPLVFCRQFLEVFLCGSGEFEVPHC